MSPPTPPDTPPHDTPPPLASAQVWQVQLLGGLRAQHGNVVLTHFGSRGVATLLARLALQPQRSHPREELIELLWPGVDIAAGRNRLRQALFTLRQLLEPVGSVAAPVVVADRLALGLVEGALECDAVHFERALREGRHDEARALYRGELLPGFYDEWVDEERMRLQALFERIDRGGAVGARVPPTESASPAAPPARAAAAAATRARLPHYLTRFFGREAEGARLRAEVLSHRLVTLLGPGGSGKTRLAVELASSLRETEALASPQTGFDLVAFVPLVTCSTRAQMLDMLLSSLNTEPLGDDREAQIIAALAGRRVLLVLDNFEQLLAQADDVLARLSATLPQLHLLVTSRHVLGLDGEREFTVQPLALPQPGMPAHEAAIFPAVALFVDRARAARADFHVGPRNCEALIALARALEGMPLALELAASRIRSLSPADMLALLRHDGGTGTAQPQLDLLARSGPRGAFDPRHASMQRVIDWSWQQLGSRPARLLAALTVFHGGFTAAAAHAVCGEPGEWPGLQLDELSAHSLLHTSESGNAANAGSLRFDIYEPIREFAAGRLAESDRPALRARHRAWMRAWAESIGRGPARAALRTEMRNLLAALASALDDGVPQEALHIVLALRIRLEDLALPTDALMLLQRAQDAVDAAGDPLLASAGHSALGRLFFAAGQREAAGRHVEAALALLAAAPSEPGVRARALFAHASIVWRSSRNPQGLEAQLAEALVLARSSGEPDLQASVLALQAFIRNVAHRDHAGGEALHAQALALWEASGNSHAAIGGRYNLAICDYNARRFEQALARLQSVTAQTRDEEDWQQLSAALNVQANTLCGLRRWAEALESFRECVRVAFDCNEFHALAYGLWNMPVALARLRRPAEAARLAAFSAAFWETRFGTLSAGDSRELRRNRRFVAVQLGEAATEREWRFGQSLSLAEAMALVQDASLAPASQRHASAQVVKA